MQKAHMTDLKENEMKNLLLETCSKWEHEESSFERRQREKQEREGYQEPEIEDDPNDNFPF